MMRRAAMMVLGLLSAGGEVLAGTIEKQITAVRTATPISLDGRLIEPEWRS
jgi:hypothetical protein